MKNKHWKSIIALLLMPVAFYLNWVEFYFAILFLIWSIIGIRNRNIFFLDSVSQDEHPVLFWIIAIVWIALSLLSLLYSEPIMEWYYGY